MHTRDGQRLQATAPVRKGDARNPFTLPEIERKFRDFASQRIGPERAEQVLTLVRDLENLADTADLVALLAG